MGSQTKRTIIHLGDDIEFNPDVYKRLSEEFNIIQPPDNERQRPAFLRALKEKTWGDFEAIFRPFWSTGGEMGKWDWELINLLPKSLKIIASAGAGYDWVDTELLAEHGIIYCNGGAAPAEAVADMAIFHILSVFRNLTMSHLAARSGDPDKWLYAHNHQKDTALNPRGRVLAIIGLGHIGFRIAEKAFLAFGMRIYYNDIVRKPANQEVAVKATFFADLDEMLGLADCVVLATPFSGKKLIDGERLAKFKKGSRLVNIARGSLVDEEAVVQALKSGHLSAVGLDVFENEPMVHPELIKMDIATLTTHNGGGSIDTTSEFERLAMVNVEECLLRGKTLTAVNLQLIKPNWAE